MDVSEKLCEDYIKARTKSEPSVKFCRKHVEHAFYAAWILCGQEWKKSIAATKPQQKGGLE